MKLLALESSAKAASCAVLSDGEPLASAWQATGLTHSRTLLPMAADMLASSGLSLSDMGRCSRGRRSRGPSPVSASASPPPRDWPGGAEKPCLGGVHPGGHGLAP